MTDQLQLVAHPAAAAAAQAAWSWTDLGTPPGGFTGPLGATTVEDQPGALQRPHVFVLDTAQKAWLCYFDGKQWNWNNLGAPTTGTGSGIAGPLGVITVREGDPQRPYLFVQATDGEMWSCKWTGSVWQWTSQGAPPTADITLPLGAVTVQDTPKAAQQPYVFVRGSDGAMWSRWRDADNQWSWSQEGAPDSGIKQPLGVMALKNFDGSGDLRRPYVFVLGGNGNMWMRLRDGDSWKWSDLGAPDAGIAEGLGAVYAQNSQAGVEQPYVFVRSADGKLWACWWDGIRWQWTNASAPLGGVTGWVGAFALASGGTRRPYVFVRVADGHMWRFWSDGAQWNWTDQDAPNRGITQGLGAVPVLDVGASTPRPYAFVQGGNGNLWTDWLS